MKRHGSAMVKSSFEYEAGDDARKQNKSSSASFIRKLLLLAPLAAVAVWMNLSREFELTISGFSNGENIPMKYARDGDNASPAMSWSGTPATTASFVLIVDDPDAPTTEPWVHWIVYNIPPSVSGLPEGQSTESLPAPAQAGLNSWNLAQYDGPQPPSGQNHLYFFNLYALDKQLSFAESSTVTKKGLQAAMVGHILAETRWTGRFASK